LRRTGPLAGHADRIVDPLCRGRRLLDAYVHAPSLPEVVIVAHLVAVREVQVPERHIPVILDDHVVALDRIAELELVQGKGVRLVVKPVECDLDRVVQAGEPHRLADQEPPPDTRLRARDHQAQAKYPLRHLLALCAPALLE